MTDEESAAIEGFIGKQLFNEMCMLYPLVSRLDDDTWLNRIKYSRNFWYHIPGEANELPRVKGPTNDEHRKEFVPFRSPYPLDSLQATKGQTQYWVWTPVARLTKDAALWFRCRDPLLEIHNLWLEKGFFPYHSWQLLELAAPS